MNGGSLEWAWFDPLKCWESLYEWWSEARVKEHLRHRSEVQKLTNEEGEERIDGRRVSSWRAMEEFQLELPCNPALKALLIKQPSRN